MLEKKIETTTFTTKTRPNILSHNTNKIAPTNHNSSKYPDVQVPLPALNNNSSNNIRSRSRSRSNYNKSLEITVVEVEEINQNKTTHNPKNENETTPTHTIPRMIQWRNNYYNGRKMTDGNVVIEFFSSKNKSSNNSDGDDNDDDVVTSTTATTVGGMSACLINLEDTIRLAELITYHYTILPLTSVVIALNPHTSERRIQRTLQLID